MILPIYSILSYFQLISLLLIISYSLIIDMYYPLLLSSIFCRYSRSLYRYLLVISYARLFKSISKLLMPSLNVKYSVQDGFIFSFYFFCSLFIIYIYLLNISNYDDLFTRLLIPYSTSSIITIYQSSKYFFSSILISASLFNLFA